MNSRVKILLYPYAALIVLERLIYVADPSLWKWRAEILSALAVPFGLIGPFIVRAPAWQFGLTILVFGAAWFALLVGNQPIRWIATAAMLSWPMAVSLDGVRRSMRGTGTGPP